MVGHLRHLSPLARLWRYTVLGATSIVFEETNPIWGGIAVRRGRLELVGVVLAVALGTWAASLALYALGRWRIDWVHRRWPTHTPVLERALQIVRRRPWRASLAVRFAYGLRLPLPIACGAARVPLSLFATASAVSCLVWSGLFAYLGLALGGAALSLIAFTHRLEFRLGLAAVLLSLLLAALVVRRTRAASQP